MNKFILGAAVFSLSMLANAQTVAVDASVSQAEPVVTSEAGKTTEAESIQIRSGTTLVKAEKTGCITTTGSRIKSRNKNGCNGEPGRSYDKEDLDRTGAISVGEALERLDPSIRISR